ncbi:hypothetical protein KDH_71670 [Dictyobacter sp. S3.2.2.5]|uniref:Translation initiation factor beta propellor-like domain-containing protein n=1 Tax=Dictyobacter halimunensis TaxID=3026934 RepID=A0ABQ6G3D8_9CHLR|nr:hypothetical protein KDH_71670 [Dictyobacter sp. S3.2.2.5]
MFLWMVCLLSLLLAACTSQPTLDASQTPDVPTPDLPTTRQTPVAQQASYPEGKVLFTYQGHQHPASDGQMQNVRELQWSPNGKRIASTDGVTLDIWDAMTGGHAYRVPLKSIDGFAWSPDGRYIAVEAYKNKAYSIQIWDTTTSKVKLTLDGNVDGIVAPVWSPDGKYIAGSDTTQHTIEIWSASSGKISSEITEADASIRTLTWAPDSQRLAETTWTDLRIWNVPAAKRLKKYTLDSLSKIPFAWSPDGKQFASGTISQSGTPEIAIRDSDTGEFVATYNGYGDAPYMVQFSPDGKRLLIIKDNLTLQIRDVARGNFIFTATNKVQHHINTAAWSPDGKLIASNDGNLVQVWSAAPGREMLTYLGLTSQNGEGDLGIASLAYAPNGQYIVASGDSKQKTIQVLNAKNGEHILTRPGVATSLAWSPNSTLIASAQTDNNVYIWNALTGQQVLVYQGHHIEISKVVWSRDGKSLISGDIEGHIQIWDASTGKLRTSLTDPNNDLFALALSPDGHLLVEGNGPLNVWNLATGKIIYSYKDRHTLFYDASWSPDSKRIASASYDHTIYVWDATTGGHQLLYRNHQEKVFLVAWSPDGKYLASGSSDMPGRNIQVWNASTGKTAATYDGSVTGVDALGWSPDSTAIALGGVTGGLYKYCPALASILNRQKNIRADNNHFRPE